MRHLKSGRKLSRRKDHRTAMLANLAASLIMNDRVKTTDAKAKEVRPFVERMITFAKRGDIHARRIVLARLRDAVAVKKLFDEIGPQFMGRFGGYTRIVKLGFRHGDNSPVSLIEFVKDEDKKKATKKKPSKPGVKAKPESSEVTEETIEAVDKIEEKAVETTEMISENAEETAEEKAEEVPENITEETAGPAVEAAPAEKTEETAPPEESSPAETKAESEEKVDSAEESGDDNEKADDKAGDEKSDPAEEKK